MCPIELHTKIIKFSFFEIHLKDLSSYSNPDMLFLDVPEAPAPPEIVSIRHESAILTWADPKDTGGSPITGNRV